MKRKMKRLISGLLMVGIMVSFVNPSTTLASGFDDGNEYIYVDSLDEVDREKMKQGAVYVIPNENIPPSDGGDSMIPGREVSRSASIPTQCWNVSIDGRYDIDGSCMGGGYNLYTEYYFNGSDSYIVQLINRHDEALMAECKTRYSLYKRVNVDVGKTVLFDLTTVTSTTNWYIMCYGECDVAGYVDG